MGKRPKSQHNELAYALMRAPPTSSATKAIGDCVSALSANGHPRSQIAIVLRETAELLEQHDPHQLKPKRGRPHGQRNRHHVDLSLEMLKFDLEGKTNWTELARHLHLRGFGSTKEAVRKQIARLMPTYNRLKQRRDQDTLQRIARNAAARAGKTIGNQDN